MPTLEDTIDFPVTTLNDLLEADAKAGVAAGADEEKYRKWAFLSSGAAGILAVILLVVLVTSGGGGGSGGGGKEVAQPKNTERVVVNVRKADLTSDVKKGATVSVKLRTSGQVLASGATVLQMEELKSAIAGFEKVKLELAVKPDERSVVDSNAEAEDLQVVGGTLEKAPAAPPATEPPPAEPAPTEQTPPASG